MFVTMDQGLVDTRVKDEKELAPGEMLSAEGVEYRLGSNDLYLTGARALSGTMGSTAHTGLYFAEFKSGSDIIIAPTATSVYEGLAGDTIASVVQAQIVDTVGGSLTNITLGTARQVVVTTYLERAYLCAGVTTNSLPQNLVRGYLGDAFVATWWPSGMSQPAQAPTTSANTTTPILDARPAHSGSGWRNAGSSGEPDLATDTSLETFSHARRFGAGTESQKWTFAAATDSTISGRSLYVILQGAITSVQPHGVGGAGRLATHARLVVRVSTTGTNGTFTEVYRKEIPTATQEIFAYDLGSTRTQQVAVFVDLVADTVNNNEAVVGRAYSIYISQGAQVGVSTQHGVRYLFCEYDKDTGRPSSTSPQSAILSVTSPTLMYSVDVTIPEKLNPRTSHVRIFREADGGALDQYDFYGFVGEIETTGTGPWVFRDNFITPITQVPKVLPPVLVIGQGADLEFYPVNQPPPLAKSMCIYQGCGVYAPANDDEAIYYSQPFQPESCSPLYTIPIRSPRNDSVVAVGANDDILLIWCRGWTKRQKGLPFIVDGVFNAAEPSDASSTRGLAGPRAYDWFSMESGIGQEWCACLDYDGLYITNGYKFQPWSDMLKLVNQDTPSAGYIDPAYIDLTEVRNNPAKRRIEVRYVAYGYTAQSHKLYFYYGKMRDDGLPKITGPHRIKPGGQTFGFVNNAWKSWSGSANGSVFLEDSGVLDASQANGSTAVVRDFQSGGYRLSGNQGAWFMVRSAIPRSRSDGTARFTFDFDLYDDAGQIMNLQEGWDPAAPLPIDLRTAGEYFKVRGRDTAGGTRATFKGFQINGEPWADPESPITTGGDGTTPGSTDIPT